LSKNFIASIFAESPLLKVESPKFNFTRNRYYSSYLTPTAYSLERNKLVGKIEFNFCAQGIQVSAFGGGLCKKAWLWLIKTF
jgi:hypothetical protein